MYVLKKFLGGGAGFCLGSNVAFLFFININYFTISKLSKDFFYIGYVASLVLALIFFAGYIFICLMVAKKVRAMSRALLDECDIDKYTELCSKIKYSIFYRKVDDKMHLASFKAIGHIARLQFSQALDVVYSIDISRVKPKLLKSFYYCTLILCYAGLRDFVSMFSAYEVGKKFVNMKRHIEVKSHVASLLKVDIGLLRNYIGVLNNDSVCIKNFEKHYIESLNNAKAANFNKNLARYNLCILYKNTKNAEKLKLYCDELVQYGKNLPMVQRAKDLLNELESTNSSDIAIVNSTVG